MSEPSERMAGPVGAAAPAGRHGGFALFADCLLVGVCTAVTSVGLVTAYPAVVAGCAALREHVAWGQSVGPLRYWRLCRRVLRSGLSGLLVPPLVAGVLALDGLAVAAGVPGGGPLAGLLVVTGSLAAVLGLRLAARWFPGARWRVLVRVVAADLTGDPGGSLLLWLAAVAAVAIAVVVPVTVLLLGGPLALAAVAVDARTHPVNRAADLELPANG